LETTMPIISIEGLTLTPIDQVADVCWSPFADV
jgi:hypothetical protein